MPKADRNRPPGQYSILQDQLEISRSFGSGRGARHTIRCCDHNICYRHLLLRVVANNQSLGFGGGVYVVNGSVSLYQNLIYNNVSGVAGGGVYLTAGSEVNGATGPLTVFITNNTIYGNTIQLNPEVEDAWVDGSQVALPGYVSQIGFFKTSSLPMILTRQLRAGPRISI
jgi:hypothetical protein